MSFPLSVPKFSPEEPVRSHLQGF